MAAVFARRDMRKGACACVCACMCVCAGASASVGAGCAGASMWTSTGLCRSDRACAHSPTHPSGLGGRMEVAGSALYSACCHLFCAETSRDPELAGRHTGVWMA